MGFSVMLAFVTEYSVGGAEGNAPPTRMRDFALLAFLVWCVMGAVGYCVHRQTLASQDSRKF